jgi:hypothetical protein
VNARRRSSSSPIHLDQTETGVTFVDPPSSIGTRPRSNSLVQAIVGGGAAVVSAATERSPKSKVVAP